MPKTPKTPKTPTDPTPQTTLTCPTCASSEVAVAAEDLFLANGGDFYCHSLKPHDSDTKATCLACDWKGKRRDLVVGEPAKSPSWTWFMPEAGEHSN